MAAKDGWWGGRAEVPRYLQRPNRPSAWRPCPRDFRDRYIELGWESIQEHYRAGWPVIARWIDECGRDELKAARSEYVIRNGRRMLHLIPVEIKGRGSRQSA